MMLLVGLGPGLFLLSLGPFNSPKSPCSGSLPSPAGKNRRNPIVYVPTPTFALWSQKAKSMEAILGQNRVEDVSWLCSLSESELDMLISLKKLVLQRARMVGYEELANKFDLKTLRALAFVLMECISDKVKDLSLDPRLSKSAAFMESCNLLKCNLGDIMSIEEIQACIGIDLKKGPTKRLVEAARLNIALFWVVKYAYGDPEFSSPLRVN